MADKTELVYDLIFNTQAAQQDVASLVVQLKTAQDALKKTQAGAGGAAGAVQKTGRAFGSAGQSIQNASFQVADFATQIQGGTDVTRALSQQLPQLLGGFGALGAAIGAGVAILGPMIGNMINLGERTKTVEQATKDATDAFDRMEASQATLNATVTELREKYGEFAIEVAQVNNALAELDKREAFKALQVGIATVLGQLQETVYVADDTRASLDEIASVGNSIATLQVTEGFAKKLGLTKPELAAGVAALKDIQQNANLEAAVPAARLFVETLADGTPAAAGLARQLSVLLGQALEFEKVSQRISGVGAGGFSFTPEIVAGVEYTNTQGEKNVESQLKQIEEAQKRQEAAQKAAATASRKAATEYQAFLNTIGRGTTPLQTAAFQIRQAEENLAKFQSRMTPEQLEQANAYLEGLRTKMDEIGFKDKWDAMGASIEAAKTPLMEFYDQLKQVGDSIAESFASGITDAFMAFIDGSKSAEDAFKEFAVSFLKQITAMILKATILFAIQTALGGMGGGLGNLLGGGGGIYGAGGVFRGGRELKKFANGGVVTSPTLFPMSSGAGLMGEAGPEAIIPLTRRNGKLGVEASPVNVTVINNSSAQVRTRQGEGGLTIEVVEEVVASALTRGGNKIDSALSRGYGLRRAGR